MNQIQKNRMSFTEENVSIESLRQRVDDLYENGFQVFHGVRIEDQGKGSKQNRFNLFYDIFNPETFSIIILCLQTDDSRVVPSLSHRWSFALNFERRIFELYGIRFSPHFWSRHFVKENIFAPYRSESRWETESLATDHWPYDKTVLQNELISREKECSFHQMGQWVDHLDVFIRRSGDKVTDAAIRTHFRADQKLPKPWASMVHFLDNLHPHYSEFWVQSWFRLQEESIGVEIPERAMVIRMAMLEISRTLGHLASLSEMFNVIKDETFFARVKFWLDETIKLKNYIVGDRLHSYPYVFGGVKRDVPNDWVAYSIEMLENLIDSIKGLRDVVEIKLQENPFFLEGIVTGKDVLDYGLGGVNLRSSGLNWDERKRLPHYFYDQLDFEVPIGTVGNNLDRVLLKMDEIAISSSMTIQLLDNLPVGEIQNAEWTLDKLALTGLPAIEKPIVRYFEAPHGFIGFSHSSTDGWKISTPSFRTHNLFPSLLKNNPEELAKMTLVSFGCSRGEMFL